MFSFKKKVSVEVVPESEYTDFSERENQYATKKTVIAALIPLAVAVPIAAYIFKPAPVETAAALPVVAAAPPPPPIEPAALEPAISVIAQQVPPMPPVASNLLPAPTQEVFATNTGVIADTSLEMLANVLDPLIQIMVAVSFPIASVIMVASCFFFMFGNNDRAWDGIMKAGLGYVLIQLSPLFLRILREVGNAVA